jgi:hypothetical protein
MQECYTTLGWKGLLGTSTLAYWSHSYVVKKINCCEYNTTGYIHNTSFTSKLINRTYKQECFTILGWKGF